METDDLIQSIWMLEGQSYTAMEFEELILHCFDQTQQPSSAFTMPSTGICDQYASTAVAVPYSTSLADIEDYDVECDNLLPEI